MRDRFVVTPAGRGAYWSIAVIMALLVGSLVPLVGASAGTILLVALVVLGGLAMFAWIAKSARGAPVTLSGAGLDIRSAFYGRTIPWAQLDVAKARVVDLTNEPDIKPRWRSNGIGLPGYWAGWFLLRNGKDGLLFVSDRTRVVAIPARSYTLMLSIADAEQFLSAAREWSMGTAA